MSDYFRKTLQCGVPIQPFMVAGVLEKNYEGERTSAAFRACIDAALEKASKELNRPAWREFDELCVCGLQSVWKTCSVPSPRYAAGAYYLLEKLGIMPVCVTFDTPVAQRIKVAVRMERMAAILNGKPVFNNTDYWSRERERVYVFEHKGVTNEEIIPLDLQKGVNTLVLVSAKVNRGTGCFFSATLCECEAPVNAFIPLSMEPAFRTMVYESYQKTYLIDDCYEPWETPEIHIGGMPMHGCEATISLMDQAGNILLEQPAAQETVALKTGLAAGRYSAAVRWEQVGTLLDEKKLNFDIVQVIEPKPGYDLFQERKLDALRRGAAHGDLLSLYRLKQYDQIPFEKIDALCDKIDRRADCADFDLLPLLWMVWEDQRERHLSQQIHDRIREAALGFRYWVDEPGPSSMFYCSENHRIGFHVCEYLAGLLYPLDAFTNCGQNGMFHSLKGRVHLVEWLDQRCRVGFDEPFSETYLPITMDALLVLHEVLPMEEYDLRNMVNVLLDLQSYMLAVSEFDGCMATPRARSYTKTLRSSRMVEREDGLFWVLFGNNRCGEAHFANHLTFSYYQPPRGICELAYSTEPVDSHYKQGIMHFDKPNADFSMRRTADYAIGGVRDHNVGMCDMHFESSFIALKNDIAIFFSAPQTVGEGGGLRPDYWAGQASLPRVVMGKRTLVVMWHNVNNPDIWLTHAHFNARRFDEVVTRDGWTFGRSGNGYVAIYSSVPHALSTEGIYAGRELVCNGNEVTWIAECGSAQEDGPFEAFIARMLAAPLRVDGEYVDFHSPMSGSMHVGPNGEFTVDGKEVEIPEYMVLSPYLQSRYGSGRLAYTCPGYHTVQWAFCATE